MDLLDRHLRWRGGREALARTSTLCWRGRIETAGLSGPYELEQTASGGSRSRWDLRVASRTTVVGPEGAWCVNASGQVEALPHGESERARFDALLALGRHLVDPDGAGIRVERLADEERDGRTWAVLRCVRGGLHRDWFVDPADGSVAWSRYVDDTATVWVRYDDWQLIEGQRVAFRESTTHPHQDAEVVWTEVLVDLPVPPERLARPRPAAAPARIEGGPRSTGWMPMTLHLDRWVRLQGLLDGLPTEIVLDSGAGITVVDQGFAERIGLRGLGKVPVHGVGGMQEAQFAELRLQIGPLVLEGLRGVILDLSETGRLVGRPMPVILGKEVFHAFVVDLDYPNSRIAFHDSASFAYEGGGTTIALTPAANGHRAVECGVEGLAPARFVLDTGSGGTVDVFAAYAEAHGLLEGRRTSQGRSGGVGGAILTTLSRLRTFTFAGYTFAEVPAAFATTRKGAFHSVENAGNLGAGIFGRFRLLFDYARDQLHVEPGPDWADRPFRRNRIGLFFEPEPPGLVVKFVAPGSPAEAAGWAEGDRVVAIDGAPVPDDGWAELVVATVNRPEGAAIAFTDPQGRVRTLVAAEYY